MDPRQDAVSVVRSELKKLLQHRLRPDGRATPPPLDGLDLNDNELPPPPSESTLKQEQLQDGSDRTSIPALQTPAVSGDPPPLPPDGTPPGAAIVVPGAHPATPAQMENSPLASLSPASFPSKMPISSVTSSCAPLSYVSHSAQSFSPQTTPSSSIGIREDEVKQKTNPKFVGAWESSEEEEEEEDDDDDDDETTNKGRNTRTYTSSYYQTASTDGQTQGATRQNLWSQVLEPTLPRHDTFIHLQTSDVMTKAFTPQGLLSAGLQDKEARKRQHLAQDTDASYTNVPNQPLPPRTGLLGVIAAKERDSKGGALGDALTERERKNPIAVERQFDNYQQQGGPMYGVPYGHSSTTTPNENEPQPLQTLGAAPPNERARKPQEGLGVALKEREGEERIVEERHHHRQQLDQMQQGGPMYGVPYGYNPMLNPMMTGGGIQSMTTGGGMQSMTPMMSGFPGMMGGFLGPQHMFAAQQAALAYQQALIAFSVAELQAVGGDFPHSQSPSGALPGTTHPTAGGVDDPDLVRNLTAR